MFRYVVERFTYGNIVGTLALFIALGGTSYAVATGSIDGREIKNNSVRSKDLRNNDVRGRDVRNGTLTSTDVRNGSLLAADFQPGQIPDGPKGDKGDPGPQGETGPTAAAASAAGTPPADPQAVQASTTISAPTAGRLLVIAHQPDISAFSPAGNECINTWALYVDGKPVPGSARKLSAAPGESRERDWTLMGVSNPVAAGDHVVTVVSRTESVPGPGGCIFGSGDEEEEPAQVAAMLVGS
jgi:hypothetical protein